MTISSDILLNTTAAAPKAASRNAVSSDKGQQNSDISSVKSEPNNFKDHLAQETGKETRKETRQEVKQPKGAPSSPQQPAKTSSSATSDNKPVQNVMPPIEPPIEQDITQQINMPAVAATKPNVIEAKDIETGGNDENEHALLGAENAQGEENHNIAKNVIAAIENNGQKDLAQNNSNIITQPPAAVSTTKDNGASSNEDRKTAKAVGITSPQDTKGGQVSQNEPVVANTNTDKTIKLDAMTQNTPLPVSLATDTPPEQKATDGSPVINNALNSQVAAYGSEQTMANVSHKGTKAEDSSPKAFSVQKATPSIAANPNASPPTMADAPLAEVPMKQAPMTQAAVATASAPQPTTEQAALAAVQQVPLNNPANEKRLKDGTTENLKETTGKGDNIAASEGKKTSAAGNKEQGSSQNSSSDQNSNKTIAELVQNTTPKGSNQARLLAKIPFVADLSQALIAGEGKTLQGSGLQLPPSLLALQEAGQMGQQTNSLNATTSLIKQPMPPVTPQMLTKQISMNILKQAQNGQDSFRINLKPAELGQVDIRMDFNKDGKMTATVTVESDRTLALLQRDQGALQKSLENAGFDAGGNSLNFSLKKQQQDQGQNNFASNDTEDSEYDDISAAPNSINSHQQMKMAYSDNALDINI